MDPVETRRPHHRRKMPSFSSSLLDSIYSSIDDEEQHNTVFSRKNQSSIFSDDSRDVPSLRRAIMIEKWIDHRSSSSRSARHLNSNSHSSSSDSSYGGLFSSSESSVSSAEKPRQTLSCMFIRPERSDQTPKHEGRFMRKTRSTALKILKQPISPRIANFLNSLFNSRTVRRTKLDESMKVDITAMRKSRSAKDSTTTHRSCLSTKSNTTSSSNRMKRSVRFCPVSIIVDEQCRPCGQKSIYENDLRNAQKSISASRYEYREFKAHVDVDIDDEDDDDVESCSSSDLFELENIGVYTEELPVYGTTNVKTNYKIANGLLNL